MANNVKKSSLSNFCLANGRTLNVCYGDDIYFAKSKTCHPLTSMDAEAVAVRLILRFHRKRRIPESYSIVCIFVKQHIKLPIFN